MKTIILLFLITSIPCFASNFDDAFQNASQAAMIQTGVNQNLEKLGQYTLERTGSLKEEVVLALFLVRTCQHRRIKTKISQNKTLTVSTNSINLDISF
jgi:hypothetical protein